MRVAGYVRVSSLEQADNLSIPTQIRLIKEYAARQDWQAPTLYEDRGKSAYNDDLAARPAFARLIADAEAARIDVVLVTDLDRLARNTSLALIVADRLAKVGCTIVSLNQGGDFRTPDGRLLYTLSSGFAEFASAQISRKTRAGLAHIAANGGYVGGLSYGALRDDAYRLAVDPARADALRLLLTLAAQGSYRAVADVLNRRAIPTPKTAPVWRETTVRSIVRTGRWLLDQPDPWPALWAAARGRPRVAHGNLTKSTRELTGMLRCACGGVIVYSGYNVRRDGTRAYGVQCRRWDAARPGGYGCAYPKTAARHYEEAATAALLALPDLRGIDLAPPDIRAARAGLHARRLNLARAVARGLPDDEADTLAAGIAAEEAALPLDGGTEHAVAAEALRVQALWPELTPEERNAYWHQLALRIVVTGRRIAVEWAPPLARLLAEWRRINEN